jgi:chromosome segregation ATPase
MQKKYKSSDKRLLKYFEESRNSWKKRSLKYQSEKRDITFKLRDTERSREKWKNECNQLKEQLNELKKKYQKIQELAMLILEK